MATPGLPGNCLPPRFTAAGDPALPGHEHCGVHGGRVVLPSRDLVVAEVTRASVFFILPVTEALQGPLAVVPNGQLGLKEIGGALREGKAQGSHGARPGHSVGTEMAARWGSVG